MSKTIASVFAASPLKLAALIRNKWLRQVGSEYYQDNVFECNNMLTVHVCRLVSLSELHFL
jgi:hypothetical protein